MSDRIAYIGVSLNERYIPKIIQIYAHRVRPQIVKLRYIMIPQGNKYTFLIGDVNIKVISNKIKNHT